MDWGGEITTCVSCRATLAVDSRWSCPIRQVLPRIIDTMIASSPPMNSAFPSFRHFAVVALLAGFLASLLPAAEPEAKGGKSGKGAKAEPDPARWEATIKKFEAADAAMPPPNGAVLLVGGSNARRWTN